MDIVPYVTEVKTSLSHSNEENPSVFDRSALGHYPVYVTFEGREAASGDNSTHGPQIYETVTLKGFNLKNEATVTFAGTANNTAALAAVSGQNNTFTVQLPTGAESGNAKITINGVDSLNNSNNDESYGTAEKTLADVSEEEGEYDILTSYYYNRQPNGENNNLLTDNLCFDVWDFNRAAARPKNTKARDIMMKINPSNGMIGFAFVAGDEYWSMADGNTSSYRYWVTTVDEIKCTGFGYAPNGTSFGLAAGGESASEYADSFNLFVSKWGRPTQENGNNNRTYVGRRSNRIGSTVVGSYDSLTRDRFKRPCVISNGEYVYVAYYDGIKGEIRFQGGKDNTTNAKGSIGTLTDSYTSTDSGHPNDHRYNLKSLTEEHKLLQVLATNDNKALGYSGEYVSIGIASNRVVMAWYNAHDKQLEFAYSNVITTANWPGKGTDAAEINCAGWTKLDEPLVEGAGQYCQLVVDSENHIHIACYDHLNMDLKYIYLSDYLGTVKKDCTVDSYQTVGTQLTIDVAKVGNYQIPYIGYMGTTPNKPRFAYLKDAASFYDANEPKEDGVTTEDKFTGIWECSVVPTIKVEGTVADNEGVSALTQDEMRRINVGVWKSAGVLTNSKISGANKYRDSYAGTEEGKCYGNGSSNAVLAYGVESSIQEFVETAQMRDMH